MSSPRDLNFVPVMHKLHVGDYGDAITAKLKLGERGLGDIYDLRRAVPQLVIQKPDGTTAIRLGPSATVTEDGIFAYTWTSTDLDIAGIWECQFKVRDGPGTWLGTSEVVKFVVEETLG